MNWGSISSFVLAIIASIASLTLASSDVKVIVYDGPKKCSNKKGDEKPTKVEPDFIVGLHFTVTIDESSRGSQDTIGKKIESSRDMGIAPSFPVGQGKVIAGLDKGLLGLCKGTFAHIIVPPHLAYGRMGKPEQGVGSDATLRYDVEIVDIQPPVPNDFVKIDANKDWKISKKEAKRYFEGLGQQINLNSLWSDEDKNDDGYISWEEFTGPKGSEGPPKNPKPQQKKQAAKQQQREQSAQADDIATLFQNIDVDNDGKISRAELENAFKAAGQEMTEELWEDFDPDGDGYVLFEEFVGKQAAKQQQQRSQSGQANDIATLFQNIDVDNDGKISREELEDTFKAAGQEMTEEFWEESDPDGDGYVLFEEFVGSGKRAGKGGEL